MNLSDSDLRLITQMISICSLRGAFKAEELAEVGMLFNKISVYLKSKGGQPHVTQTPHDLPTIPEEKVTTV